MEDPSRERRAPPPSRAVVRRSVPDGLLEGERVLPPASLAPFVHHLWTVRWALRTPFAAETLPYPSAHLRFELDGGVRRALVAGVRTGREQVRRKGTGRAFGITFRAAAFQHLLGAPMA